MAPVVIELQKHSDLVETKVCVTAQHREMLDQILDLFEITPEYDLNIMKEGQDLTEITTRILDGMKGVIRKSMPDIILVHGDTTTSLAASLAGFYNKVKIGHIEAGLRTYNMHSPWPEEMNRQLTDRISDFCFASTLQAGQNLVEEKIKPDKIIITGNTVIDALTMIVDKLKSDIGLENKAKAIIMDYGYVISDRTYILVTGHRRESFGDGFLNICKAIQKIASHHPEIDIVYPVHLNPNVKKPVYKLLSHIPNVYLLRPLEYLPFVYLMQNSHLILTDSGGIQEEAPTLGKPVVVMRDITERMEAVEAGTAILVGTNYERIVYTINELLNNNDVYHDMIKTYNPYGDGKASRIIVNALLGD